jgi:hypothetical protein
MAGYILGECGIALQKPVSESVEKNMYNRFIKFSA